MNLITLLEQLASNVHNRTIIDELINAQPAEVKEAFQTNNAALLKNQLGEIKNLADKSSVVQLKNN